MFAGMGKSRFFGLAAVLLGSLTVSGCASPGVCTTIGWTNTVGVELSGNAGVVTALEMCADGVCTSSATLEQGSDEPLRLATEIPKNPSTSSPASTRDPSLYSIARVDERAWKVSLDMQAPEMLTLRAVSAEGEVLAEREFALEWRRVGGTERCGGPHEAGPVSLEIPS